MKRNKRRLAIVRTMYEERAKPKERRKRKRKRR
jgi:hypothetical protein